PEVEAVPIGQREMRDHEEYPVASRLVEREDLGHPTVDRAEVKNRGARQQPGVRASEDAQREQREQVDLEQRDDKPEKRDEARGRRLEELDPVAPEIANGPVD